MLMRRKPLVSLLAAALIAFSASAWGLAASQCMQPPAICFFGGPCGGNGELLFYLAHWTP